MASVPLKLLLIEDNDDDAFLVIRELERGGYLPAYQQVHTADRVSELLDRDPWDALISDYAMGQFTGKDALRIMQEKGLDLPFIVISGTIGEDVAVQMMKAGAHDYLMKGNLTRLVPAIRRELAEAKNRKEKKQSQREKELLLDILERRNNELKSIVYISSHDLRSPMVNIQGFSGELSIACQTLEELFKAAAVDFPEKETICRLITEEIPTALYFIQKGGDKMQRLINGLLEFSQIGILNPKIESIDVDFVVRRILESMTYQIRKNTISVECDALPECAGDVMMTEQLFTNLIDNAVKYRHPDRPLTIRLSGTVDHDQCTYWVRDNGIGIETQYLGKIFDIFYQLNPDDRCPGVGLGLTIVKSIVDHLNGAIGVQSEVGQGTTFIVTLPRVT